MKILVFSDTHLTEVFEKNKYFYLKNLIDGVDKVIINGDFWDGRMTSFSVFVNSRWKKLFPLLKRKKTVYIYGNHDPKEYCDHRVNLFSIHQTDKYLYKNGAGNFIIQHGKSSLPFSLVPKQIYTPLLKVSDFFDCRMTKYMGKNSHLWGILINKIMKQKKKNGFFSIYADTHYAEFDPACNFANTGFIRYGFAQYIMIENKKILIKEEKYE
ncbi:MAG: metallophosphoesterase family protein [Patescibacteria group bacterium]